MSNIARLKILINLIINLVFLIFMIIILILLLYFYIITLDAILFIYIGIITILILVFILIVKILTKIIIAAEFKNGTIKLYNVIGFKEFDFKNTIEIRRTENIIRLQMMKEGKEKKIHLHYFIFRRE